MADDNKHGRNLEGRELRTQAPKPNIIRIELLDGSARTRYLGTIQAAFDNTVKKAVYDNFAPKSESVFYGFLKNQGIQGLNLNADWSGTGGSGGLLGDLRSSLKAGSGTSLIGEVASAASSAIDVASAIEKAAKSFGGFDSNLTGSSSIKQVKGVDMGDLSVSCGWYLPEQLSLASASLRILTRMVYPRQVADEVLEQFARDTADVITGKSNELDEVQRQQNGLAPAVDDGTQELIKETDGGIVQQTARGVAGGIARGYTGFNSLVGRNLTVDPLPVRISVGHYIDLEPLVITGIDISFSREQWVSPNGRHLPIFCDVDIKFSSWLNPAPKLEFMQLLGTEMFGLDAHQEAVIANIEASRKREAAAASVAAEAEANQQSIIKKSATTFSTGVESAGNAARYSTQYGGRSF